MSGSPTSRSAPARRALAASRRSPRTAPWHLEVGISNFTGNGDYEIPYGGPDPEVVIDGPPGTFSNETWMPGGLPFAGSIHFEDPHHMGLGFIAFQTADESAGIRGAGGMTCVYPDDE